VKLSNLPYDPTVNRATLTRLARAALVTAITDGLFSSILVVVFYHGTFARLWQGVASTLLGRWALEGGTATIVFGLYLHLCVATGWSLIFLTLISRVPRIQRVLRSRFGPLKVAGVYGPFIWLVMSLVVIPLLTHRPPAITYRWWIQLFGHIPFVAIPIVVTLGDSHSEEGA